MNKSHYVPLICRCGMRFAIHKDDYDKNDAYNCPMCLSHNVVTPEDLKPVKPFRPSRKVPPTVMPREA